MKIEFPQRILENYSDVEFHENFPVGAEFSLRTDRQTDMTKLIVAYCNFVKAPNTCKLNVIFDSVFVVLNAAAHVN